MVMYRLILFFLQITVTTVGVCAQGFNWQYSSRMPMQTPTVFAGVHFSGSLGGFSGELVVPETLSDGSLCEECGPYNESTRNGFGFGLDLEYWLESHASVLLAIEISQVSEVAEFTTSPVTVFGGEPVTTLLDFSSDATVVSLETSYLRRIGSTQLLIGGGLGVDANLTSSVNVTQTIEGTSSAYFEENGVKTKQRTLTVVEPEYALLTPSVHVMGGYQFPVALGMFCRATAFFEVYPMDVVTDTSWTGYTSGISVSVFLGLNPKIEL